MSNYKDFKNKNTEFTGTKGIDLPTGSTGERDTGYGSGTLRFNSTTNLMEYYTGTEWKAVDAPPIITGFTIDDVGGSAVSSGFIDATAGGNATIEVLGSLFDTTSGTVTFEGSGETLSTVSITRDSSVKFTVTVARSGFDNTNEPYAIRVTNGSGLSAVLADAISQDAAPAFTNAADTNYDIFDGLRGSVSISAADLVEATDPDGDTVTYSVTSGSLPSGLSLNSSTGAITGSTSAVGGDTVSTFTIQAATASQNSTRQFTITQKAPVVSTFSYTGSIQTISVPSGVSTVYAEIWGASVNSAPSDCSSNSEVGGGGHSRGYINSVTGNLYVEVGDNGNTTTRGWPNGGNGASGSCTSCGGGGSTAIFSESGKTVNSQNDNTILMVAGGGGGTGHNNPGNQAGHGGGSSGGNADGSSNATGGTQNSGGNGGSAGCGGGGQSGSFYSGGNASNSTGGCTNAGGGGGGGWYGGGAGGTGPSGGSRASAGGGSGYLHPSRVSSGTTVNYNGTNFNTNRPGGIGDQGGGKGYCRISY